MALKMKAALAACTALGGLSSAADATITIYTTQASYLAAISAPGTDTFDNVPLASVPVPSARTAGAYSYSASTAAGAAPSASTLYGAGSGTDHWLSTNISGNQIVFSGFTAGIVGVGGQFFGSDANGLFVAQPDGLTLTATDASGTISTVLANPGLTSFLGFVSTTGMISTTVQSNITTVSIWPTANNLILGRAPAATAVPEPASWALMMLGFGLTGAALRRRSGRPAFANA